MVTCTWLRLAETAYRSCPLDLNDGIRAVRLDELSVPHEETCQRSAQPFHKDVGLAGGLTVNVVVPAKRPASEG